MSVRHPTVRVIREAQKVGERAIQNRRDLQQFVHVQAGAVFHAGQRPVGQASTGLPQLLDDTSLSQPELDATVP